MYDLGTSFQEPVEYDRGKTKQKPGTQLYLTRQEPRWLPVDTQVHRTDT